MLVITPITLKEAKAFIAQHHHHNKWGTEAWRGRSGKSAPTSNLISKVTGHPPEA